MFLPCAPPNTLPLIVTHIVWYMEHPNHNQLAAGRSRPSRRQWYIVLSTVSLRSLEPAAPRPLQTVQVLQDQTAKLRRLKPQEMEQFEQVGTLISRLQLRLAARAQ